ncbi:MAG: LLM class flavin-dependent oxidoreductase [Proteobacteria bacterium]|nr:LLM class flavin-dependent oxidoreductase [Pseudomonadota bacterium]
MSNKNAQAQDRKYWAVVAPMPGPILVEMARQAEASGLEGLFAAQLYGPPFASLAVAAAVTERIKIASGIAIAAARSPFETATAIMDLDHISMGRAVLGLGTSVSSWTTGVFGAPEHKPLTHLRDTIGAVRHVISQAGRDQIEPYDGVYFKADFLDLQPMTPPVRPAIPIWIAALREKLVRMGAEIGDGVIGHPMWSVEWTVEKMKPAIEDQLKVSGRARSDIEVNVWPMVAPNPNEAEALDDARPTIAFYAGAAQYESFFEAHGFGKEARACQEAVRNSTYKEGTRHVPDEMVRAFFAIGDIDKVRERIEPIWSIADSVCLCPPIHNMTLEKQMFYHGQIAALMNS